MQVKANIVAIHATCSFLVIAKPLYKGIHASQSVHIYFKYISLLLACRCDAPLSLPPRGHENTEPSFSILSSHDLELLCPKVAAGLKVVCLKVLGQTGFEFALVSCA